MKVLEARGLDDDESIGELKKIWEPARQVRKLDDRVKELEEVQRELRSSITVAETHGHAESLVQLYRAQAEVLSLQKELYIQLRQSQEKLDRLKFTYQQNRIKSISITILDEERCGEVTEGIWRIRDQETLDKLRGDCRLASVDSQEQVVMLRDIEDGCVYKLVSNYTTTQTINNMNAFISNAGVIVEDESRKFILQSITELYGTLTPLGHSGIKLITRDGKILMECDGLFVNHDKSVVILNEAKYSVKKDKIDKLVKRADQLRAVIEGTIQLRESEATKMLLGGSEVATVVPFMSGAHFPDHLLEYAVSHGVNWIAPDGSRFCSNLQDP